MIEDPIRDSSPSWVNANIDRETLSVLQSMKDASPEEIEERVDELAWEYDVSCATTLTFAGFSLAGLGLSRYGRGFLAIPAIASGLLVWENLPVPSLVTPLFRLFGFRSRTEIERERHALKMLRGDYRRAEEDPTAKGALTSAQAEGKVTTKKSRRSAKRNLGAPVPESEIEPAPPAGEDLHPMEEPAPSGPSGNPSRH